MNKFVKILSIILCLSLLTVIAGGCTPQNDPSSNTSNPNDNGISGVTEVKQYGPKAEKPSFEASASNSADVKSYGAKGDGVSDDSEAFRQAMKAVNNKGYLYLAAGKYHIASNLEVPEEIVLVVNRGAYLDVAADITLNIKGFVDAGCYRVFTGNGNVSGSIRNAAYPQWFGSMNDSNDDTALLQKAINACNYVQLPATTQYELGTLHLNKPVTLIGIGAYETSIKFLTSADVLFSVESSQVAIMQMNVSAGKGKGATIVKFDNSQKDLSDITLYRLYSFGVGRMVDTASAAHNVTKVEFVKVLAEATLETGVHMVNFKKDISMDDVIVSNLYTKGRVDFPLFLFEGCEDMFMINTDAAGGAEKGIGADGFYFRNCKNVTVGRSMVDYANGFGLVLENCSDFEMNHWINSLCQEGCTFITGSKNIVFNIANNNGNGMKTHFKNPDAAVVVENSSDVIFKSLYVQNHCSDGVRVKDSNGVLIENVIITGMNGRGYVEEGTSNNNTVKGITIDNVNKTPFTQVGANSNTYALIVNGGAKEEHIQGAATK